MNIFFIFLYMTFFSFSFLPGEERALPLTFHLLKDTWENAEDFKNGRWIEIRGFLYKTSDGNLILAATPDLKSCCVGSASKKDQQILVLGDLANALDRKYAVALRGVFFIEPDKPFPFRLENAAIVEENKQVYAFSILAGGILLTAALFFYFQRRK